MSTGTDDDVGEAHFLTLHFTETNTVYVLRRGSREGLRNVLRLLADDFRNAGWAIATDLAHSVTGYPQVNLETNTGQEVILQVTDEEGVDESSSY